MWTPEPIFSPIVLRRGGNLISDLVPKLWANRLKTCWLSYLGCNNLLCQPRKLISPTEPWSRWLVSVPTLPSDRSPCYPELNRIQAAFETLQSPSTWKSWCSLKMASPASSDRGFRPLLVLPILPFLYPPTVPSHHIIPSKMKRLLFNSYSGSQGKGRRWGFLRSRALFTGTSCKALKGFLPWNQSDLG